MPITHGQGNPDWTKDETILALDLVLKSWPRIPGKGSPEVQALSALIRCLPIHSSAKKNDRFRNPDGVYLKLQQLASLHADKSSRKGLRPSITDRAVWADYANDPRRVRQLADEIEKGIQIIEDSEVEVNDDDDFEAPEGKVLTRVHKIRERQRGLRPKLIKRVETNHGRVLCEACAITAPCNGRKGLAIFEAHHTTPLGQAASEVVTRLRDLVLLCANCHRLIHALMRERNRHYTLADFNASRLDGFL